MENTVEFFIEKVRNRPCLWNQNHVSYRDMGRKDLAWDRVAKECGMANGREAKTQWKKLRDSHREALRRRKPTAGPSAQYLKPWKYEEDMKFILSQMENKEVTFFCNDSNDTEESANDNNTETNSTTIEISVPGPTLPLQDAVCGDPLYTDPETRKRKEDITDILEEREKLREERERHRDGLIRQIVDMNRTDALSKFFDSLCQKTRELPRYLQLRIQREIFESVTRAEEEALSLNPSCMDGYSPMPSSSPRYSNNLNAVSLASKTIEDDYSMQPEYEPEKKFSRKSEDSN